MVVRDTEKELKELSDLAAKYAIKTNQHVDIVSEDGFYHVRFYKEGSNSLVDFTEMYRGTFAIVINIIIALINDLGD